MIWALEVVGKRPTTLNQERKTNNWGKRASDTKWWREQFCRCALEAGIPAHQRLHVSVYPLHKNGRSPQDVAACFPAAKAGIDGLVDAGVIEDDTPDILVRIDFYAPVIDGVDGLRLVVQGADDEPDVQ
jgi:crossover junction endodeoxyribonuclease RusA